ncbi:unnamed protein product, partial [Laminaria digitata]
LLRRLYLLKKTSQSWQGVHLPWSGRTLATTRRSKSTCTTASQRHNRTKTDVEPSSQCWVNTANTAWMEQGTTMSSSLNLSIICRSPGTSWVSRVCMTARTGAPRSSVSSSPKTYPKHEYSVNITAPIEGEF